MNAAAAWVPQFTAKHGRAPRILHVGNVANNAFNNARFLNAAGLDCDVISNDYYHIMGSPEWEMAELVSVPEDQFRPRWTVCASGYERPKWFAQGPLDVCIRYLIARREGRQSDAHGLWQDLAMHNGTGDVREQRQPLVERAVRAVRLPDLPRRLLSRLRVWSAPLGAMRPFAVWPAFGALIGPLFVARAVLAVHDRRYPSLAQVMREAIQRFRATFPQRADALRQSDFAPFVSDLADWQRLFSRYDLIVAYATCPMLPMLARKRPYVGYEHGTLRDFTLADSAEARLTALAYNEADHVFITNGDCLEYARKIGVKRYTGMVHPIDDSMIRSMQDDGGELRRRHSARHIFLCTLRHDWAVKGTDKYIRALPLLAREVDDFVVLMTRWGAQVPASMELARELGVAEKIHWIDPLPKRALARMQKSVDVQFDQIALPHFGSTAPEAMAAGIPVIMSYDPRSTEWIIPEPAPILSAWTVEDIVRGVKTALDPAWREDYRSRAAAWVERWHSSERLVEKHLQVYGTILHGQSEPT